MSSAQPFVASRLASSASTASRMNCARRPGPHSLSIRSMTDADRRTCVALTPSAGLPMRDGVSDTARRDKPIPPIDFVSDTGFITVIGYGDKSMTPHTAATGHEYSPDGSGHCRHCGADGPHLTARREAEKTERERSMEREAAAELYAAIDQARRDWNTDVSIKAEVAETLLAIAIEARDLPPEHVASDRGDPGVNEKDTTAHSKAEQDGRGEDTPCRSPVFSAAYDSIRKSAPGLSDRTCEAIARSIAIKVRHAAKEATPAGEELREKLEVLRRSVKALDPRERQLEIIEEALAALQPQAEGGSR